MSNKPLHWPKSFTERKKYLLLSHCYAYAAGKVSLEDAVAHAKKRFPKVGTEFLTEAIRQAGIHLNNQRIEEAK